MEPYTIPGMTGRQLRRLMRINRVTIRELARRMSSTMKSIRRARITGATFPTCLDYWQAATGAEQLTPRLRAQLRHWMNTRPCAIDGSPAQK